jgi:hypothetical protein
MSETFPRPKRQFQTGLQIEECYGTIFELSADDAFGRKPQAVFVKSHSAIEVIDTQGDQRYSRFHGIAPRGDCCLGMFLATPPEVGRKQDFSLGVVVMESNSPRRGWQEIDMLIAARERILLLLGSTQRPLRWAEIQNALGFLTREARLASEWLMDHGYIAPVTLAKDAARSAEALWALAEKGRHWAKNYAARAQEGV